MKYGFDYWSDYLDKGRDKNDRPVTQFGGKNLRVRRYRDLGRLTFETGHLKGAEYIEIVLYSTPLVTFRKSKTGKVAYCYNFNEYFSNTTKKYADLLWQSIELNRIPYDNLTYWTNSAPMPDWYYEDEIPYGICIHKSLEKCSVVTRHYAELFHDTNNLTSAENEFLDWDSVRNIKLGAVLSGHTYLTEEPADVYRAVRDAGLIVWTFPAEPEIWYNEDGRLLNEDRMKKNVATINLMANWEMRHHSGVRRKLRRLYFAFLGKMNVGLNKHPKHLLESFTKYDDERVALSKKKMVLDERETDLMEREEAITARENAFNNRLKKRAENVPHGTRKFE